jgi:hypothetical protein
LARERSLAGEPDGQRHEAEAEWRRILEQRGIMQLSATAPFARLALARTLASQLGTGESTESGAARAAYRAFLSLWKDAPVLPHPLIIC